MKISIASLILTLPTLAAFAATNQGGAGSFTQTPAVPQSMTEQNMGSTPAPGDGSGMAFPRTSGPSNPATELQRSTMTEIVFSAGSDSLSPEARQQLDQVMREARRRGKIEQVKVLGWGDVGYPAPSQTSPITERDLANRRNTAVETYIESRNSGVMVQGVNMAERPTALQDLLSSSDARTKHTLENAGLTGPNTQRISRAILMVVVQ